MTPNMILLLMFGSLTLFMLTGLPIAFVLGGLSLLFTVTLWEPNAVIVLVLQIYDTMKSEALLAIPLFILMACILQRSGVIESLYHAMALWFGRLRGGLAIGTVFICVIMAAMTGVVGAAVTAMGILALPEMLRRGYQPRLALGTICASGTLGILIPPSVLTIVYAVTAQVSIGQMLIAGIVPGLLLALLYMGYILIVGWLKPEWLPIDPEARQVPWSEKLRALKSLVFPCLLIVLILGSIFFGIATPTESAAVGVAGSIEVPMAVGLVGGATKLHPSAKLALKILGVQTAEELARVIAAVGLAQNFSALKALATTGIQRGHMALHAQNIAMMAGAVGDEVERLARVLVDKRLVRLDVAEAELKTLREG